MKKQVSVLDQSLIEIYEEEKKEMQEEIYELRLENEELRLKNEILRGNLVAMLSMEESAPPWCLL